MCADAGWHIEVPPGGEIVATNGEHRLEPEALVRKVADGVLDEDEFRAIVERAGLGKRAGIAEAAPARRPAARRSPEARRAYMARALT